MGDSQCGEWFGRLIGRVPTDPNVLARLGLLHAKDGDESQAFHHYLEAYRYYQVNMDVISWLGAYFVKNEVYDKAMQFFERAAQIQPQEVKWQLMVASCHRRRGDYAQSKRMYEDIHRKYPENMECLRYLVHLCKDSGLIEEANEWFKKVKKLEQRLADGGSGTMTMGNTYNSNAQASTANADQNKDRPPTETGSDTSKTRTRGPVAAKPDDDDDEMMLPGT